MVVQMVFLPFEKSAPCGKLSSWLCSASQEYRAFASLREKKKRFSSEIGDRCKEVN